MKYDYIFFDLDGTLTDPAAGICTCVQYALDKGGYKIGPKSRYYPWIGPPLVDSFKNFIGVSQDEAERLIDFYRERFSTVGLFENSVYPGIPELLAELTASGATLAVATGKPTVYSNQILEHFGLLKFFDFVSGIGLDSEGISKQAVISTAMNALGITDSSKCVMIGDRLHDIEGARGNDMASIYVLYGYGSREEAADIGAGCIVESVEQLRNVLI